MAQFREKPLQPQAGEDFALAETQQSASSKKERRDAHDERTKHTASAAPATKTIAGFPWQLVVLLTVLGVAIIALVVKAISSV